MAKVGQWNLAVAVKALVEAVEQHLREQERKSKELQPISPGETYEVVLCNGTKLVGSVDERGPTWVKMRDEVMGTAAKIAGELPSFIRV